MFVARRVQNLVDVRQPFVAGPDTLEILVTDEPKAAPGAGVGAPAGFVSAGLFPNLRDATQGQRDVHVRYAFDPDDYTTLAAVSALDVRDDNVFFACIRGWTGAAVGACEPLRAVPPIRKGHGMTVTYRATAAKAAWLRVPLPLGVTAVVVRNLDDAGPARLAFADPTPANFKAFTYLESNTERRYTGPGLSECWVYGDGDARAISFDCMWTTATGP